MSYDPTWIGSEYVDDERGDKFLWQVCGYRGSISAAEETELCIFESGKTFSLRASWVVL